MKRTDLDMALLLYAALFNDIATWDVGLHDSLVRDYFRIEKITKTRGLSFLMIDLPEAGKVFDNALSAGYLEPEDLPKTLGRPLGASRELFCSLFAKVFGEDQRLLPNVDPDSVFFLRCCLYMMKKVRKDCSDAAILAEVESFREIDYALRAPSFTWDSDTLHCGVSGRVDLMDGYRSTPDLVSDKDTCPRPLIKVCQAVSDRVISLFPELDWRMIDPKHGPGAVSDARTGTDKFQFHSWPKKLENLFPYSYFAQSREDMHLENDNDEMSPSLHEYPTKLIAVPKTLKAPRLIASEPAAHQYLQHGIMRWLREHLPQPLRTCIDFNSQEPSRVLCLEASKHGSLATVDLKAASDRLSLWLVERVFRTNPSVLQAFHASRTRWLTNATGVGPDFFMYLKKFAPQGSGVTFPTQSIVFAIMSIAATMFALNLKVSTLGIKRASKLVRVYGDDIILPSVAVPYLADLMAHFELKINASKTHWTGHFRESCGMDAYLGHSVTPLYVRDLKLDITASSLTSWVDVVNNAYSHGLWHVSEVMRLQIPGKLRPLIPVSDRNLGCLTLRTYQPAPPMKTRISQSLMREEVLGLCAEAKVDKKQRETHHSLLQYFLERPHPEVNWSSGYVVRKRSSLKKRWVPV